MSATQHDELTIRLADAMLDSHNGADVSAAWGPRIKTEQTRRTRMMAARLIKALPAHGLTLADACPPRDRQ